MRFKRHVSRCGSARRGRAAGLSRVALCRSCAARPRAGPCACAAGGDLRPTPSSPRTSCTGSQSILLPWSCGPPAERGRQSHGNKQKIAAVMLQWRTWSCSAYRRAACESSRPSSFSRTLFHTPAPTALRSPPENTTWTFIKASVTHKIEDAQFKPLQLFAVNSPSHKANTCDEYAFAAISRCVTEALHIIHSNGPFFWANVVCSNKHVTLFAQHCLFAQTVSNVKYVAAFELIKFELHIFKHNQQYNIM